MAVGRLPWEPARARGAGGWGGGGWNAHHHSSGFLSPGPFFFMFQGSRKLSTAKRHIDLISFWPRRQDFRPFRSLFRLNQTLSGHLTRLTAGLDLGQKRSKIRRGRSSTSSQPAGLVYPVCFVHTWPGRRDRPPDLRIAGDRASFAFVSASILPLPARVFRIRMPYPSCM